MEVYNIEISEVLKKILRDVNCRQAIGEAVKEKIVESRYGKTPGPFEKRYASSLSETFMNNELEGYLKILGLLENVALRVGKFLGNDFQTPIAMLIVSLYDSIITEWARVMEIKLTKKVPNSSKERYFSSKELLLEINKKIRKDIKDDEALKFSQMIKGLGAILDKNQTNFRNKMIHQAFSGPLIDDKDLSILVQNLDLLIDFYKKTLDRKMQGYSANNIGFI